jgi:hypothetical protein
MFSDPGGTNPTNLTLFSILMAWAVLIGLRGWYTGKLLAFDDKVTIRHIVGTRHLPWAEIDCFVADTKVTPVVGQIQRRRRVLGVRLRSGYTNWLPEASCRAADGHSTRIDASVARLNELLAVQSPHSVDS